VEIKSNLMAFSFMEQNTAGIRSSNRLKSRPCGGGRFDPESMSSLDPEPEYFSTSTQDKFSDLNKDSLSSFKRSLKKLSDEKLDQNLYAYIKKEKEVLMEILCHIAEVDRRRLYLTFGYPSLYSYLTERMGYEGGSAQRRLDAARLSHFVPGVINNLAQGELTLSQVTFFQKSLRQVKEQKVTAETKATILESIKHKTLEETQVHVAKALQITVKDSSKVKHQADASVRLEVTLSKPQWEKVKTMRELLSTVLPHGEWDQVLEYVATQMIAQKSEAPASAAVTTVKSAPASIEKNQLVAPKKISPNLKRQVLLRDQCCQYKDKITGKICQSKWNLEVDHIQPLWANGTNSLENLRALCSNHNKYLYQRQASIRRV